MRFDEKTRRLIRGAVLRAEGRPETTQEARVEGNPGSDHRPKEGFGSCVLGDSGLAKKGLLDSGWIDSQDGGCPGLSDRRRQQLPGSKAHRRFGDDLLGAEAKRNSVTREKVEYLRLNPLSEGRKFELMGAAESKNREVDRPNQS